MAYNQQDIEFLQPLLNAVPGYPGNLNIDQAIAYLNSTTFKYPIFEYPKLPGIADQFTNYNIGTSGAEVIHGAANRYALTIGLSGNDTFIADQGWDSFWGGAGSDTYYVYKPQEVNDFDPPPPTIIWDFEVGSDRLFTNIDNELLNPENPGDIKMLVSGGRWDEQNATTVNCTQANGLKWVVVLMDVDAEDFLASFIADGVVAGTDDNDVMGVGYADYAQELITNGADVIVGNGGNDTIKAGAGDDTISGDDGNDLLLGEDGNDNLDGGDGNDLMYGQNGNDRLYGGDGSDGMAGGAGVDIIHGDNGDDRLYGEDGNDYLYGDNGNDRLMGGNGSDRLYGGEGKDSLEAGAGSDQLYGQNGDDRLFGEDGGDRLNGGNGNDLIYGQNGNDRLYGGTGSDGMDGGADDDMIYGESGDDRLYGQAGRDKLFGGTGNDRLYGGTGNDGLDGGAGNDMLYGQDGYDRIYGGAGNDTLSGGAEGDVFVFGNGFGKDRVIDFDTKNDLEYFDLRGVSSISDVNDLYKNHMSQSGSDVIIDAGGGNIITIVNVKMSDLGNDFLI